jgi:hemolysin III
MAAHPGAGPPTRPRLRGVAHQYAFVVSLGLGALLVAGAPTGRARFAAAVFAASVAAMFGASALYHRVTWKPRPRRWLARLDHATIYALIAGTYTPYAILVLSGPWRVFVLSVVWGGALVATAFKCAWLDAPKWLAAAVGIALGWAGVIALPQLASELGVLPTSLAVAGGLFYMLGAIVYARRRPDPVPSVFGYHELFHALVVAAAACQYAAVAFFVVPRG